MSQQRFHLLASFFALLGVALLVTACGPRARIKAANEGDIVSESGAGIETYNRLVTDAVNKLFADSKIRAIVGKKRVTIVAIESKGVEELGEAGPDVFNVAETRFVDSEQFEVVSWRAARAALRESGVRDADKLFLAEPREKFLAQLRSSQGEPHYLVWGEVTTLSSDTRTTKQRDYKLTLQFIDAETGQTVAQKIAQVRKEYR